MINIFSDRKIANCFIGTIVRRGGKQRSNRYFFYLIYSIKKIYGVAGLKFIRNLLDIVRPKIFLSSKKIAGVVHKIPTPISSQKSYSIAIHWIINSSIKRNSRGGFRQALVDEVVDIYKNPNNSVIRKRDEFHRLAHLNKPFLRFYKF